MTELYFLDFDILLKSPMPGIFQFCFFFWETSKILGTGFGFREKFHPKATSEHRNETVYPKVFQPDMKDIENTTIHFLEHCNVLDGDFDIKVASRLTDEVKICKYIENLRVITGHVRINNWPGETLGCFERLQYIGGKTITNAGYEHKFSSIGFITRQAKGSNYTRIKLISDMEGVNISYSL